MANDGYAVKGEMNIRFKAVGMKIYRLPECRQSVLRRDLIRSAVRNNVTYSHFHSSKIKIGIFNEYYTILNKKIKYLFDIAWIG